MDSRLEAEATAELDSLALLELALELSAREIDTCEAVRGDGFCGRDALTQKKRMNGTIHTQITIKSKTLDKVVASRSGWLRAVREYCRFFKFSSSPNLLFHGILNLPDVSDD